jgi:hypothetical protein
MTLAAAKPTARIRIAPAWRAIKPLLLTYRLAGGGDFGLGGLARQWVIRAFIKLSDAVTVKAFFFNL